MKIFLVILFSLLAIISLVYTCMWCAWWYPRTYEYALQLADDASLPQVKADYLKEYVAKIKTIEGEPRWIFTRPDLDLDKQTIILEGLIQRFEDIAKIPPSDMAYQQGMFQLTGQEIDNQVNRISNIFQSAKARENPLNYIFMWWGWVIFGVVAVIIGSKGEDKF